MTYIKKITLQGFKSFARKTTIDLMPGFNCIIGPNGAGKSNILDALCFVLGKSSAKGLRVEKSSNLIYNGGKKGKPAEKAMVSLIFDNSQHIFPFGEDVEITRIVKQNGQSVYKINGKIVTRQEILELLSLAKIRPEGYNIILQGDIIRFIDMSSKERRKVVEDASGIFIYEEKKEKALRELTRVEERIHEANIILAERKAMLEELEKDYKMAKRYKSLEEKIKSNKKTILLHEYNKKLKEKENIEKRKNEKESFLEKTESELEKIEKEIAKIQGDIEGINKEIEEKGEKDQIEANRKVETLKVEIAVLKEKFLNIENELKENESRKKQLLQEQEVTEEKIERIKKNIDEYKKQLESKEKTIKELTNRVNKIREDMNLSDSLKIEEKIKEIEKEIERIEEDIGKERSKEQEIVKEIARLEAFLTSVSSKIDQIKEIEKKNKEQLKELNNLRDKFKKISDELDKAIEHDSELAKQISNARIELEKRRERYSRLKSRLDSINEIVGGDLAIKNVLNKNFDGVYGTIGQLGSVEKKYSKALTVAVGGRIKNIVVEDDKVAEKVIEYVKKEKLGVVTLLPLKQLDVREIKIDMKIDGIEGFAIDLIKYEKKYEKAFRYILGNTLVVRDIATARKIGIGKGIRMVTLDGDLIEAGGAMRGGYRRVEQGFKEKEDEEEFLKLKSEIEDYEKLLRSLNNERNELEDKIVSLRNRKADLEGEIIKLEKALHISQEDLGATKEREEELKKEMESKKKELENLRKVIKDMTRKIIDLKEEREELKEKISASHSPARLAELNSLEEVLKKEEKEALTLDSSIKTLTSELNTILLPERDKIKKIIKDIEKKTNEAEKRYKEIKNSLEEKEKELKKQEKISEEMFGKFKGLFKRRNELNKLLEEKSNKRIELLGKKKELEIELNNITVEKARIVGEISGIEEELKLYEGVEEFKDKSIQQAKKEVKEFENMINRMGAVNLKALETYELAKKELESLEEKKGILEKEKEDVNRLINEIDTKKKEIFMKTFSAINKNFSSIFKLLSVKGEAFLELENEKDPFDGGVVVKVRLKGKKFLDIRSLSGGEKTLTALSFIFALQEYEPAFFYVFDEVDAALDKRNSEKLGELIREYSKNAQYIVITHNDAIIENAHYLFGVSIDKEGVSKITSIQV